MELAVVVSLPTRREKRRKRDIWTGTSEPTNEWRRLRSAVRTVAGMLTSGSVFPSSLTYYDSVLMPEQDWIKSRDYDDDQGPADNGVNGGGAAADSSQAKKSPQKQWIRAPNDAALRNTPCPICQEKFESTWSEEVQDWIWQDAVKGGSRVYHGSCYAEVTKDGPAPGRGGTPLGRTGTPDSVLGKRKAEVGPHPLRTANLTFY